MTEREALAVVRDSSRTIAEKFTAEQWLRNVYGWPHLAVLLARGEV